MAESHQDEEEFFEDEQSQHEEPTPPKGQDAEFLSRWNELTGRNDKDVDSIVKQTKEAKRIAEELGVLKKEKPTEKEKEEVKEPQESPAFKSIYFKSFPEAEMIWDSVSKDAQALGKDPFELYENSRHYKAEAKVLYEEKLEKDKAEGKVLDPSKKVSGTPSSDLKLSPADLALLRRRGLKPEDVVKNSEQ